MKSLALEASARRWLERVRPWALTVLVNSRIMTLYLWHLTVMVALAGVAIHLGYVGLDAEAGSSAWWLSRPPWIAVLLTVMLVFLIVLGRYEQPSTRNQAVAVAPWRIIGGSVLLSAGLALMATGGVGDPGPLGLRLEAVLPALAGALLVLVRKPFAGRGG